jgi:hypothetical protein
MLWSVLLFALNTMTGDLHRLLAYKKSQTKNADPGRDPFKFFGFGKNSEGNIHLPSDLFIFEKRGIVKAFFMDLAWDGNSVRQRHVKLACQ